MLNNVEHFKITKKEDILLAIHDALNSNYKMKIKTYDGDGHLLFENEATVEKKESLFSIKSKVENIHHYKTLLMRLDGGIVKSEIYFDESKFIFENKPLNINGIEGIIEIEIDCPKEIYKLHKRKSSRVIVPKEYGMMVTCDTNKDSLKNLEVINISTGGILVGVRGVCDVGKEQLFENAIISIHFPLVNIFNVPMKIKYIQKEDEGGDFNYKLGLQFNKIPTGLNSLINKICQS